MERRSGLRIAWSWMWHSMLGALVGLILSFIGIIVVSGVLFIEMPRLRSPFGEKISIAGMLETNNTNPFELLIIFPVFFMIFAFCQAYYQKIVLKQIVGNSEGVDRWTIYSTFGAGMGGVLAVLLTLYPPNYIDPARIQASGYLVLIGAIVVFQWRVLKPAFSKAHLWIWGAFGVLLFQMFAGAGALYYMQPSGPTVAIFFLVLSFTPLVIKSATIAFISKSVIPQTSID